MFPRSIQNMHSRDASRLIDDSVLMHRLLVDHSFCDEAFVSPSHLSLQSGMEN
jgi:hypothetical protein